MTLTVGSLFSGIGGLDLGLERAGMNVIWQSEIDPYACRVLSKHWPEVVNHGNIKEINWQEVEKPDVICGGYPCQPFSTAGKRRGEEDPRHLWPWVRTAISELRPRYAILENVRGHLSMGGLSVIGELASIGYDAEWRIVSAASVGANHRRDRVIIVAYPNSTNERQQERRVGERAQASGASRCGAKSCRCGENVANSDNARGRTSRSGTNRNGTKEVQEWQHEPQSWLSGCSTNVADTDSTPRQQQQERQVQEPNLGGRSAGQGNMADSSGERCVDGRPEVNTTDGRVTTQPQLVHSSTEMAHTDSIRLEGQRAEQQTTGTIRSSEIPNTSSEGLQRAVRSVYEGDGNRLAYSGWEWWTTEPNVGRVAHGIPKRVDRLRGLGNAVVPQVAEVIGRLVISHAQQS
jgi:DNA (cytosine-5)-methyltransferase 1